MGEIIVITSGKGGVGKTTTTANLGTALALLDKRVIVIDADIGLRNLDVVLGAEDKIIYDIMDVLEGSCTLEQALIQGKNLPNLHLLPASQTATKDSIEPEQMRELCAGLKEKYDFVLIDCPAGIERGFKNAMSAAERALVVATPDVSSVRDADRIIRLLLVNDPPIKSELILNRVRMDFVERGVQMNIEDITEILPIDLIGVVPDDSDIIIAASRGESVVTYSYSRPGTAYRDIARRMIGMNVEFMDLSEKTGFFSKLRKAFK